MGMIVRLGCGEGGEEGRLGLVWVEEGGDDEMRPPSVMAQDRLNLNGEGEEVGRLGLVWVEEGGDDEMRPPGMPPSVMAQDRLNLNGEGEEEGRYGLVRVEEGGDDEMRPPSVMAQDRLNLNQQAVEGSYPLDALWMDEEGKESSLFGTWVPPLPPPPPPPGSFSAYRQLGSPALVGGAAPVNMAGASQHDSGVRFFITPGAAGLVWSSAEQARGPFLLPGAQAGDYRLAESIHYHFIRQR
ncbi:hypothetical protein HDU67_007288 [Dinochytrium kinnereticum]|nr:hypothetical protein HDU67_007288 [Dinochytrium kinnereticum]